MPQPEFAELSTQMLLGQHRPPRIRQVESEAIALPDFDELLVRLAELCELLGVGRCASAYQLYAPEDLPEEFGDELELVDQRALLRRLVRYAGGDDERLPVELVDGRRIEVSDLADHLAGNLVYAGVVGEAPGRSSFVVFDLGDLRTMMGISCVELARAMVHSARLATGGESYREGRGQRGSDEELPSELDGFLASFALGWGLPVTNACLDPRSVGLMQGQWATTAWVSATLSFPPDLAARLLAVIYHAGRRDETFLESRREALNPSQRELFDDAYAELEASGEDAKLGERLRWGAPEGWPAPLGPALDELEFDAHDEALLAAQERRQELIRQPNAGQPVFRARPARTLQGLVIGLFGGGLLGPALGVFGPVLGACVGGMIGRQFRGSLCSAPRCGVNLTAEDSVCPSCGGVVIGEIARAKEHLAALEDYEAQSRLPESESESESEPESE